MTDRSLGKLPADLLSELEKKYFWWEPADSRPRPDRRVIAQAMDQANFVEIRRLETVVGPKRLADIMRQAQPGWLSDRSWELWRGRLSHATDQAIPEEPPRRSFNGTAL
jgi:hypothetical protein